MAEIELIEAVAGQKNKASDYNENFNRMKEYIEASIDENETYIQQQLTTYSDINSLASSGTISLGANTINKITPTGAVTFTLPTITDNTKFYQILVQMKLNNISYIDMDDSPLGTTNYFNDIEPRFDYSGNYDLVYTFDSNEQEWYVGAIYKG